MLRMPGISCFGQKRLLTIKLSQTSPTKWNFLHQLEPSPQNQGLKHAKVCAERFYSTASYMKGFSSGLWLEPRVDRHSFTLIPWDFIASSWSGFPLTCMMPPCTLGCRVFTRPSIISGKPVYSETSVTFRPAARIACEAFFIGGGRNMGRWNGGDGRWNRLLSLERSDGIFWSEIDAHE